MFYIVIGQSGAGKTTFVKSHLLREPYTLTEDVVPLTADADGRVALGRYGIGKRTEGTDTLPYNAKDRIKKQLSRLAAEGKTVVLEGDRINNSEIFDHVLRLGGGAKLYLVTCKLHNSMKRLRAAGSTISPTFVKGTRTKAKHMFLAYASRMHGEIINTDGEE